MVKVLRSFVRGPLEPYVEGFAGELSRLGYTRCSAEQHVCFIAHLDRWLAAHQLSVGDLNATVVDLYLTERRAAGYVNYRSGKAMRPLLNYLDQLGVLPYENVTLGPVSALLERYRSYLLRERGLTPGTTRCYLDAIRPFMSSRLRGEELDLAELTAADVTGFVVAACSGRPQGTAKLIVTTLRSLLTWLHIEGVTGQPLAGAVPAVAGWRLTGCPARSSQASCAGCWPAATGAAGWDAGTTRSCCCCPDSACGPVRLPRSDWTTWTGALANWSSGERATGQSGCPCRRMSGSRSSRICVAAAQRPRWIAACSSVRRRRTGR